MEKINTQMAAVTLASALSSGFVSAGNTESLFYLPDDFIQNPSMPKETWPRNPANKTVCDGDDCKAIAVSFGAVDQRQMVTHGQREYDSVLHMVIETNEGTISFCTATMTTIEGFALRYEGTAISTAAHCLKIKDVEGNIIGEHKPEDITFYGSFLNAQGEVEHFKMMADETWINPLYSNYTREDTALIFSHQLPPDEIKLPVLVHADFQESLQTIEGSLEDSSEIFTVSSAGFSADKPYLTVDECVGLRQLFNSRLITPIDYASGASGGPVFTNEKIMDGCHFKRNKNLQHEMVAVNSSVIIDEKGSALLSYFNSLTLKDVSFLRAEEDPQGYVCTQHALMMVNGYDLTAIPGEEYSRFSLNEAELTNEDELMFSAFSQETVEVLGTTRGTRGKGWALVKGTQGRAGYVRIDSEYLDIGYKSCVHEANASTPASYSQ